MREKTLLKISLFCTVFGLIGLYLISSSLKVDESIISKLDETNLGSTIKISGVVTKVDDLGSAMLLDIAQMESMKVIAFTNDITLNKGDNVEVLGKLDEYNGRIELIADKITLK